MQKNNILGEDALKEGFYAVGKGFEAEQQYAAAGLSFAKATGYNDADEQSKINWGKGAVRNTISVDTYSAVGIKPDGTIVSAISDELINSDSYGIRGKINIKLDDWKNIVSIIDTDDYIAGLTDEGNVLVYDTGYHYTESHDINTSDWKDIVAIDVSSLDTVAGLDKNGRIKLSGWNANDFADASNWENIVDISFSAWYLFGVDIYGKVHMINNGTIRDWPPMEENEVDSFDVVQFSCDYGYGAFITREGDLRTTATPERAEHIHFINMPPIPDADMDVSEFQGFNAQGGTKFVQCEASDRNYVGLLSDGTVKVGGERGDRLASFGADKWKDIKEVHLGITSINNPVILGVTSDGSVKVAGYEGGEFIPFHEKIRAWGKLRKPTVEF